MNYQFTKKLRQQSGFTIIEVMIAVAIIGLIMVIVFLAIPQAQVKIRDDQRKAYARTVYESMLEFIKNNGRLPGCDSGAGTPTPCGDIDDPNAFIPTQAKNFLLHYMPTGKDPSLGKDYVDNTTDPGVFNGGTWHAGNTYLHFDSATVDHSGLGDPLPPPDFVIGHVVIAMGHWCSYSAPESDLTAAQQWYPIHSNSVGGTDLQLEKFVILIGTERGNFYCLDNYDHN
jgi:prepilin-type N-terminal cleavage/methylation domain-containing protein